MRQKVVIGITGDSVEMLSPNGLGAGLKWQPNEELCLLQHVHCFELLHDSPRRGTAEAVAGRIKQVSPQTAVRLHEVDWGTDPWDFESVYLALETFALSYPFTPESEYFVHVIRGTWVMQICLFLLVEARHIPAKLVHNTLPSNQKPHGEWREVDLSLAQYDRIMARFHAKRSDAVSTLKRGIQTRNQQYNTLIAEIERVAANTTEPILLLGPTGAGKSDLAELIFNVCKERKRVLGKFVAVNCATIRGEGALSALFGHVKGAFTGASHTREGFVMEAHNGVLFLDEIGDLGIQEQSLLLRALDKKRFPPLGSEKERESNFQLIAATNRDLRHAVLNGGFREDLLARIEVWSFALPGLAERREDIEPNLLYELDQWQKTKGQTVRLSKEVKDLFLRFGESADAKWKANFRDLKGAVTRMATFAENGIITRQVAEAQIKWLRDKWRQGDRCQNEDESLLIGLLGPEGLAKVDPFDRFQLAGVVRVCQESASCAAAGRILFGATRQPDANDSSRLAKYLDQFGLHFKDCQTLNSSRTRHQPFTSAMKADSI